jgi:hypothetical protein
MVEPLQKFMPDIVKPITLKIPWFPTGNNFVLLGNTYGSVRARRLIGVAPPQSWLRV